MRSIEDKGCLTQEVAGGSCMSFEFKSNGLTLTRSASHHHRTTLGKPTPSKWDDAQKWLVNLSRGEKNPTKASPRNSNADDRRLIAPPVPKKDYSSGDEDEDDEGANASGSVDQFDVETKTVDCDESVWRINRPASSCKSVVRSVCVRDMGTEMTPIASQEPSRTATPIRATTPAARSPVSSGTSTPARCQNGVLALESVQPVASPIEKRGEAGRDNAGGAARQGGRDGDGPDGVGVGVGVDAPENKTDEQSSKTNPLETRAAAWDEAERAKYMAR